MQTFFFLGGGLAIDKSHQRIVHVPFRVQVVLLMGRLNRVTDRMKGCSIVFFTL